MAFCSHSKQIILVCENIRAVIITVYYNIILYDCPEVISAMLFLLIISVDI